MRCTDLFHRVRARSRVAVFVGGGPRTADLVSGRPAAGWVPPANILSHWSRIPRTTGVRDQKSQSVRSEMEPSAAGRPDRLSRNEFFILLGLSIGLFLYQVLTAALSQ